MLSVRHSRTQPGSANPAVYEFRRSPEGVRFVESLCITKEWMPVTQRLKFEQLARYGFGPKVMRKTKLCPECGTLVTDGSHSCPCCGKALPELTLLTWYEQQHKLCRHCGTVLSGDCRYCPRCGKRVGISAGKQI